MEPVTAITTGLAVAKGATSLFKEIKDLFAMGNPEEALGAINQAEEKVSDLLGTLITVQESVLSIQEENRQLKENLSQKDAWEERLLKYKMVETEGKGIVYQHLDTPFYYACPVCIENKYEIHPLQDQKVFTGVYLCPACNAKYNLKPKTTSPGGRKMVSSGLKRG